MSAKKAHHQSNGFVWGLIIGGGLMYLLSTPNGRKILQEISEGGIDKLEDFIDVEELTHLKENLSKQFEEGDLVEKVEEVVEAVQQAPTATTASESKRKRLFKGIKRR